MSRASDKEFLVCSSNEKNDRKDLFECILNFEVNDNC